MSRRGERFARGVTWGVGAQAFVAAANVVLIPRIIHAMGTDVYGVYLLMLSCSGWVLLLHMGAGAGTVRYASEAIGRGDPGRARAAAIFGAELQLIPSGLAALVLWFAAGRLATGFFALPESLRIYGQWMIRAAALGGFFSASAAWAAAVFQGYQNFRRFGVITAAQGILPPFGIWAALALGHGLGVAAAWFVSAQATVATLACLDAGRLLGKDRSTMTPLRRGEFIRFSLGFWPASFAQFASGQLDRTFVAGLRSLSEFTLYSVPLGLLQRLQTIPASTSAALLPAVSEIAAEDKAELLSVYLRSTRVLIAMMAPAYGLLFLLMPQFLALWIGGRFVLQSVWPARLMTLTQALSTLAFTATSVAGARRGGLWPTTATWSQAAVCLLLWPFLIPRWGLFGAAAGSLAAQAVATGVIWFFVHRHVLSLTAWKYAAESLTPALAGTAALAAVGLLFSSRVAGWTSLAAVCAVASTAYALVAWPMLPAADRDFIVHRAANLI